MNFNFNLGEAKAWTLSIKPAYLWNMNANPEQNILGYAAGYDSNYGYLELEAGITYHFGNSNGTHHFTIVRPYDQAEVDALNAQINDLRSQLDACGANNAALLAQLADLQAQLDACNRRPAVVEKVVKDLNNIRYVFFNCGSAYIAPNQQPNIAMVADQLKETARLPLPSRVTLRRMAPQPSIRSSPSVAPRLSRKSSLSAMALPPTASRQKAWASATSSRRTTGTA